ncbi:uncharacterized protein [Choristoneura fumiferana]|uniref:uncharacterized protein n=1 Tax=Choristoneura fumiferana TaxID=7141 RepID=UPI003D158E16
MKPGVCFALLCALNFLEAKKYKVKLISVGKCPLPAETLDASEPVLYEAAARRLDRRTSVIRANFTVRRAVGPVLMNFRIYQLSPRRALSFELARLDCRSPLTYQLVRVLHLTLDNDCYAQPGSYVTDNINLQDFAWILSKVMVTPGKYEYNLEFGTSKGIALCTTIMCDILETK